MKPLIAQAHELHKHVFDADTFSLTRAALMKNLRVDLVVLWGGTDISTSIYGETNARAEQPDTARDLIELEIIKHCVARGIPILGICRGAQLLCAALGGRLWQHVTEHLHAHEIKLEVDVGKYKKGQVIMDKSNHHQMMRPTSDMLIVATSLQNRSGSFVSAKEVIVSKKNIKDRMGVEPEIVFSEKHKALMIQGHPEWCDKSHEFVGLTKAALKQFLNVEV